MNTNLAPTYQRLLGDYWILWYRASNSYSVVDTIFKTLLDVYLESDTPGEFASRLAKEHSNSHSKTIAQTISAYLKNCNTSFSNAQPVSIEIDESHRFIEKSYLIKGKVVKIFYDSELVAKTIHPALEHLSIQTTATSAITFDIYLKHKQLHLFKNKELLCSVPQQEYHRVQGKFIMHLLCFIHNKAEEDWLGTFHGSTITDGNSSLLFVGASGQGKSTLCALLVANGFNLLADDVSPMLSKSKNIYSNPSALSIKKGAFKLLQPLVEGFEDLPITHFVKSKGQIKYLPCKPANADAYDCKGIILVNYKANAKTTLETITAKILLETLIPESWLSPDPEHAKEFLDWLSSVNMYQLTYSDSKCVTSKMAQLFDKLKTTP